MKIKHLTLALAAVALSASAQQGFKDGLEYFRANQPEEARIILNNTLHDSTTDKAIAHYYLGQVELLEKDYADARKNFEAGLQVDPQDPYNYVGLGAIELLQGNRAAAEAHFKEAKARGKKNADLLTDIARAYYNADPVAYAKEIDKYIADAKKAQKNHPAPFILEGDMIAETNPGGAAAFYENAQMYDSDMTYPEAYVKYARAYFGVNPKFSINKLKELLEKQPNSALAQRELAEKYYENNQLTMAAEQYGKYIQNPNHFDKDKQRYVGLLYFGQKYQDSYDLATKLLAQDPDNFYMQRMQFLDLAALKKYPEASEVAKTFFAHPKQEFTTNDFTTYSEVLKEIGQDSLAVVQIENAIAIAPEKVDLLKDLSAAYSSAGRYVDAANKLQEFVDKGDYSTNDLVMLARRYQNAALSDTVPETSHELAVKGLDVINKVIERVPDNPRVLQIRATLTYVAEGSQDNETSYNAFKELVDFMDNDPENFVKLKDIYLQALNRLGNYAIKNKDNENAKIYFSRMLELVPENNDLRAFIEKL
ncbi:MAG: tetratricopeptide repeat protein [Muribaculaceae bacterium]|nr:tetratricopeptide repeat protein [Muribaculaceae bacterium]